MEGSRDEVFYFICSCSICDDCRLLYSHRHYISQTREEISIYTSTTERDKEKPMTYFQVDNCGGCVFLIVETIICLLLSSIRSDQFCAVQFCSLLFVIGKWTCPQVADANVVGSCRW